MTNQNERPVSILLRVGIVIFPGVFSWFTLRKGYSSLARIVSFSWLIIGLYAAYPLIKKEAQAIPMIFGFLPEHVKAQQCLTVSRYLLDENEASIFRKASGEKINYWLKNQSGCSGPIQCSQQEAALINYVELRSAPNGNSASPDIIKKWINSDYCQALAASYRSTLSSNKQTTAKAIEPVKSDPFQIKLYFIERGLGTEVHEAVDFQKNKLATFCYDTDELNNIKLEGGSNKKATLIIENNDQVIFKKDNIIIDKNTIINNDEIKVEPGPVSLRVKILQDGGIIFQGNVESKGCT